MVEPLSGVFEVQGSISSTGGEHVVVASPGMVRTQQKHGCLLAAELLTPWTNAIAGVQRSRVLSLCPTSQSHRTISASRDSAQ